MEQLLPHEDFTDAVKSGCTIVAHNANFERVIWKDIMTPRYGWPEPKIIVRFWIVTLILVLIGLASLKVR